MVITGDTQAALEALRAEREEMLRRGDELIAQAKQLHEEARRLEAKLRATIIARNEVIANAATLCSNAEIARALGIRRQYVSRIATRARRSAGDR